MDCFLFMSVFLFLLHMFQQMKLILQTYQLRRLRHLKTAFIKSSRRPQRKIMTIVLPVAITTFGHVRPTRWSIFPSWRAILSWQTCRIFLWLFSFDPREYLAFRRFWFARKTWIGERARWRSSGRSLWRVNTQDAGWIFCQSWFRSLSQGIWPWRFAHSDPAE